MEPPDSFVADAVPSPGKSGLVVPVFTPASNGCEVVPPPPAEGVPSDGTPAPYGGGPRTEQGKENSRRNALTHGLTAKTLLPEVLDPNLLAQYLQAFTDEYRPQTPTETLLVHSIASHAVALARAEQIENALLRVGAAAPGTCLRELGEAMPAEDVLSPDEIALAAVADSERLDRITRYAAHHEKALDAAIEKLEKRQRRRKDGNAEHADPPAATVAPPAGTPRFSTEEACNDYLSAWARAQPFCCPKCGHGEARWLAAQRRRQCTACRRQVAVRDGTVMAGSHASLLEWFLAIECLLRRPDAATAEVAEAAGITRSDTARRMARKIREALDSHEASKRLAGLDTVFGRLVVGARATTPLHEAGGEGPTRETMCPAPAEPDLGGSP